MRMPCSRQILRRYVAVDGCPGRWLLPLPSQLPSGVRGQWAAAVVSHHVTECACHIRGGSALAAIQLKVGAMEIPHYPFGIKKICEVSQVSRAGGLQGRQASRFPRACRILHETQVGERVVD